MKFESQVIGRHLSGKVQVEPCESLCVEFNPCGINVRREDDVQIIVSTTTLPNGRMGLRIGLPEGKTYIRRLLQIENGIEVLSDPNDPDAIFLPDSVLPLEAARLFKFAKKEKEE